MGAGGPETGEPLVRTRILAVPLPRGAKVDDLAAAIDHAIDNGADVVNVSLVARESSPRLEEAVHRASKERVPIIAAAGNHPALTAGYPARLEGVYAVTALADNGDVAPTATYKNVTYGEFGGPAFVLAPTGGVEVIEGSSVAAALATRTVLLEQEARPDESLDPARVLKTIKNRG